MLQSSSNYSFLQIFNLTLNRISDLTELLADNSSLWRRLLIHTDRQYVYACAYNHPLRQKEWIFESENHSYLCFHNPDSKLKHIYRNRMASQSVQKEDVNICGTWAA